MSSSAAPAVRGLGAWAAPGIASTPPRRISRGSPSNAELSAFKRAVRPAWWSSLWPFYATALLGAAVAFVASAAPPPVTVRRMLTPAANVATTARAATPVVAPAREEYQLPAHWRAALGPPPRPCDPMSGVGC